MQKNVEVFAKCLELKQSALGDMTGVKWQLSSEPVSYREAEQAMEDCVAAISKNQAPELIWFLEHPPLYTAGTSAKVHDLLMPDRFPVFATGRGGEYTYHGPGQLVAYVMFDLNRRGRDVRCHVNRLEDWVISALHDYGIEGQRRPNRPGIWVTSLNTSSIFRDDKIAAIGVRVRRWITFHGVSINICPDLSHYSGIIPCGIGDAGVTSIAKLGK